MRTGGSSGGWDSGQVGFIYATKATLKMTGVAPENVEAGLIAEVQTYDQYLRGDVWGYTVYDVKTCDMGHTHEEVLDSCWGFYGHDSAQEEGEASLQHLQTPSYEERMEEKCVQGPLGGQEHDDNL